MIERYYGMALDIYEKQFNMSLNFKLIKELWKKENGDLGENCINENKYNFSNIYGTLERSKDTIKNIISGEWGYEEEKVNRWAERIYAKTGIEKEFLTGEKLIVISDTYKKTVVEEYKKFKTECDEIDDMLEKAKDKPLHWSASRIRAFIKRQKDSIQRRFEEEVKMAETAICLSDIVSNNLKEEVEKILKTNLDMIKDIKIYKLLYLIKKKQRYDEQGAAEVISIIRNLHTPQLRKLGKEGLENYIGVLEEHLGLVKSVYTVYSDLKEF